MDSENIDTPHRVVVHSDIIVQIANDIGHIKGRVDEIHREIYGNGKPGLLKEIAGMKTHCLYKHEDVTQQFVLMREQMKKPAEVVSVWKERAKGAGWVLGGLAGFIAAAVTIVKAWK